MASEEIALVLSHRHQNQNSQLLFQDDSNLAFRCNPPHHHQNHRFSHHPAGDTTNSNKTTRELTGFIEHQNRHYQPQATTEFRRSMCEAAPVYHRGINQWDGRNGRDSSSPSGDGSDSDDDDDEDDGDMDDADADGDGDGHVVRFVNNSDDIKNACKSNVIVNSVDEKNVNGKRNHISSIGNDINDARSSSIENHQLSQFQNAITIADSNGEMYYSQYLHGGEGSGAGIKDMLVENSCGFSGRKDVSNSGGSGESLRTIFSDPLTGVLMDDAMILPCGHSFGSSGMQHVMKMIACYTCSNPVSEGSVAPNLSLRSAVHAFRREEDLQSQCASKRRNYGGLSLVDQSRGRGVQFPFFVTERVIIKGNKRTPPRFVGREAVVTTQCLNGWYVVKTLDNAESVKLQYRSLAKVQDSSKSTTPNWLPSGHI